MPGFAIFVPRMTASGFGDIIGRTGVRVASIGSTPPISGSMALPGAMSPGSGPVLDELRGRVGAFGGSASHPKLSDVVMASRQVGLRIIGLSPAEARLKIGFSPVASPIRADNESRLRWLGRAIASGGRASRCIKLVKPAASKSAAPSNAEHVTKPTAASRSFASSILRISESRVGDRQAFSFQTLASKSPGDPGLLRSSSTCVRS